LVFLSLAFFKDVIGSGAKRRSGDRVAGAGRRCSALAMVFGSTAHAHGADHEVNDQLIACNWHAMLYLERTRCKLQNIALRGAAFLCRHRAMPVDTRGKQRAAPWAV
jgi:hypothetical protein